MYLFINTQMHNSILMHLVGHSKGLCEDSTNSKYIYVKLENSILEYIQPKEKDLTSSILSSLT